MLLNKKKRNSTTRNSNMKTDEEVVKYKKGLYNNSSIDDGYINGWRAIKENNSLKYLF